MPNNVPNKALFLVLYVDDLGEIPFVKLKVCHTMCQAMCTGQFVLCAKELVKLNPLMLLSLILNNIASLLSAHFESPFPLSQVWTFQNCI